MYDRKLKMGMGVVILSNMESWYLLSASMYANCKQVSWTKQSLMFNVQRSLDLVKHLVIQKKFTKSEAVTK